MHVLTTDAQQCFFEQAVIEGRAVKFAEYLSRSAVLTVEERAYAGDCLRPQEAQHMRFAHSAARFFGHVDPKALRNAFKQAVEREVGAARNGSQFARDLRLIVLFNLNERFFLRKYAIYRNIVLALLPEELSAYLEQLREDERGHRDWGSAIIRRIRQEYPEFGATIFTRSAAQIRAKRRAPAAPPPSAKSKTLAAASASNSIS